MNLLKFFFFFCRAKLRGHRRSARWIDLGNENLIHQLTCYILIYSLLAPHAAFSFQWQCRPLVGSNSLMEKRTFSSFFLDRMVGKICCSWVVWLHLSKRSNIGKRIVERCAWLWGRHAALTEMSGLVVGFFPFIFHIFKHSCILNLFLGTSHIGGPTTSLTCQVKPLMLNAKQGVIGPHYCCLWWDSAGDGFHGLQKGFFFL